MTPPSNSPLAKKLNWTKARRISRVPKQVTSNMSFASSISTLRSFVLENEVTTSFPDGIPCKEFLDTIKVKGDALIARAICRRDEDTSGYTDEEAARLKSCHTHTVDYITRDCMTPVAYLLDRFYSEEMVVCAKEVTEHCHEHGYYDIFTMRIPSRHDPDWYTANLPFPSIDSLKTAITHARKVSAETVDRYKEVCDDLMDEFGHVRSTWPKEMVNMYMQAETLFLTSMNYMHTLEKILFLAYMKA